MSTWSINQLCKKPKLRNPIFVEGLPGIGNVGKVVIDFVVDELDAKKIYEITSNTFPHSVFVNEDNIIQLPKIEFYYKELPHAPHDLVLMGGDVQPIDEISSYDFSEKVLDLVQGFSIKELITLGGIGLGEIPKKPRIYCTGNSKKIIGAYKSEKVNEKLYGVVGPIVGVSGLLLGLAARRKMDAICLLAETYGHPMYLGIKGAKELLNVLNERLKLNINVNKLEKEIAYMEKQLVKRSEEFGNFSDKGSMRKPRKEITYIG